MHKEVLEVLEQFKDDITALVKNKLFDIVLHGSTVDDSFVPGKGDIDFLVFLSAPVNEAEYVDIKNYHKKLRQNNTLMAQLEGCYLVLNHNLEQILGGVYIGSTESRWRQFEGNIFNALDRAHISAQHYALYSRVKMDSLFKYDFKDVKNEIILNLNETITLLDRIDDYDFKLHAIHASARSLFTYRNHAFISKKAALKWLSQMPEFNDYSSFIESLIPFKSMLTADEKNAMQLLPLENIKSILLKMKALLALEEDIIYLDQNLRLRKPQLEEWPHALKWYQNKEIMYFSEGITDRFYDMEDIKRMYQYLSNHGNLYFIETFTDIDEWLAIGDTTFSDKNLPIVIGDSTYWGQGIGRKVITKFIELAHDLQLSSLTVPEIYHYNERSANLFLGLGFVKSSENEVSSSYIYTIT